MGPRQFINNKKEVEVKEEDTEMLNDSISSEFDTIKDKKVILEGYCNYEDGLWDIPIPPKPPYIEHLLLSG